MAEGGGFTPDRSEEARKRNKGKTYTPETSKKKIYRAKRRKGGGEEESSPKLLYLGRPPLWTVLTFIFPKLSGRHVAPSEPHIFLFRTFSFYRGSMSRETFAGPLLFPMNLRRLQPRRGRKGKLVLMRGGRKERSIGG